MDLEPHGPDVFVGISPVYPWGRLYGGQVVAQALRAAAHTVDTAYSPHSLHAYFIRGGTSNEPVRFEVDRIRNGRSFVTRRVVARQSGGAILNLSASFQISEEQPEKQTLSMPDLAPPDAIEEDDGWGFMLDRRYHGYPHGTGRSSGWIRITTPMEDDPLLHACGLAFTSDTVQFGAINSSHPIEQDRSKGHDERFVGASLDHGMWFHRPARADQFHLYEFESHGIVGGRGLAIGNVFSSDGTHVATIAQEVLMRYIGD
ncbi:MAG: acyl-CoA thioesterase II [Actinomycetia bacterium]|nr:acyl-CoA thioesterase II [Actinomycetes bacterium]